MERFINFDKLPVVHGHWHVKPDGVMHYESGKIIDKSHPHYNLQSFMKLLKKISSIKMHDFFAEHGNEGTYKVGETVVRHGDLPALAEEIEKIIHLLFEKKHMNKDESIIENIACGQTSLRGKIIQKDGDCLHIIYDSNNSPVCSSLRRNRGDEKNLQRMKKDIAKYLAHEHHRASVSIHGTGLLHHCPDHIPHNISPFEFWPDPIMMTFRKNPSIVQFEHKG